MDKLLNLQEVQALTALLGKTPMSPAEQLWAQAFANRLFNYVNEPELDTKQPKETVTEPE